jgi:nucleoside-diphosphate-sugar epimerase
MTILITGGTGLVGCRLVQRLLDAGIDCRVLVRDGHELPGRDIAVKGDVLEPATLAAAVEGVSDIVHLAATLRTPDARQIWSTNRDGTRNLISAAHQYAPHARFILASTGMVYNMDSPHPGRENDTVEPKMAYPASKVAAESELRASGLTWSILRFGFVYGDKDGHLHAVPRLARMFKWHPAMKLSLVHHVDIMRITRLALSGLADGRTVNVTDDAPTSIFEIAALVGDPIAASAEPLFNPWSGQIDGTLARSLGFQPKVASVFQAFREGVH